MKKDKLKKILKVIAPGEELESFKERVARIRKTVNQKLTEDFSIQIKNLQKEIHSKHLSLQTLIAEGDKTESIDKLDNELSGLKSKVSTLEDLRKKNVAFFEKKVAAIENIQTAFNETIVGLNGKDTEIEKTLQENVQAFGKSIEDLRKEIILRISNLGGGSMNRKITVEGVDVLTQYTDINLYGSTSSLVASVNNAKKRVDIRFPSGGSTPNLQQVTDVGNTTTKAIRIGSSSAPNYELDVSGKAPSFSGAVFSGSGLNDATGTIGTNQQYNATYVVTIDGIASPYALIGYTITSPGTPFAPGNTISGDDGSTGTLISLVGSDMMYVNLTSGDFSGATQINNGSTVASLDRLTQPMAADTFSFTRNGVFQGGSNAITGAQQTLGDTIKIQFTGTTGHTMGDAWTITYLNNNIVNASGYYRLQNLDNTFAGLAPSASSDGTIYQWPATSSGSTGTGTNVKFLRNKSGALSWDTQSLYIGEPVSGATVNRALFVSATGALSHGDSQGWIELGSGINIYGVDLAFKDTSNNVFYQFDLGPAGTIKLGDISGAYGTNALNNFNLVTGNVNYQIPGTFSVQDTSANSFFKVDIANKSATFSAGLIYPYVAVTATYAILINDYTINCTSGTFTTTLPTAVGVAGQVYVIKNSGAGVITLAATGAETIDGAATLSLAVQYQSATVQSNGVNWIVI